MREMQGDHWKQSGVTAVGAAASPPIERVSCQRLQVLGAYNAWDEGTEEAWRWMWNIVQSAFAKHLDSADELAQTVSNSWDYITNTLDLADISAKFFSSLFQQVPELQKLFVKPTKMQTVMLGKALDLIVRSLTDTHVLDVELQGIAMRHIKYDINQGHLDTFGQVDQPLSSNPPPASLPTPPTAIFPSSLFCRFSSGFPFPAATSSAPILLPALPLYLWLPVAHPAHSVFSSSPWTDISHLPAPSAALPSVLSPSPFFLLLPLPLWAWTTVRLSISVLLGPLAHKVLNLPRRCCLQILMATFADMLGADHWDEDVQGAWLDVYSHIAEVFGHVISSGRNLVSKALATNNTDDLKAALDLTPRRYRAKAALEIEVDDTVVLPITWTISEGQFAMTDALLRDVLAIRGDRSAYYYGRKLLYEMHPWIVHVLTEKAPKLLPTFLDGHMWTSR